MVIGVTNKAQWFRVALLNALLFLSTFLFAYDDIAVSEFGFSCSLKDGLVVCWGKTQNIAHPSQDAYDVPTLVDPVDIDTNGYGGVCAAHKNRVTCWGGKFNWDNVYKNPTQVVIDATGRNYCVLDDDGVACRGFNDGTNAVPECKPKVEMSSFLQS